MIARDSLAPSLSFVTGSVPESTNVPKVLLCTSVSVPLDLQMYRSSASAPVKVDGEEAAAATVTELALRTSGAGVTLSGQTISPVPVVST